MCTKDVFGSTVAFLGPLELHMVLASPPELHTVLTELELRCHSLEMALCSLLVFLRTLRSAKMPSEKR